MTGAGSSPAATDWCSAVTRSAASRRPCGQLSRRVLKLAPPAQPARELKRPGARLNARSFQVVADFHSTAVLDRPTVVLHPVVTCLARRSASAMMRRARSSAPTQLIGALLTFESQLARRSLGVAHHALGPVVAASVARATSGPLAELVGQRRSCPRRPGDGHAWSVRTGPGTASVVSGLRCRWWRFT